MCTSSPARAQSSSQLQLCWDIPLCACGDDCHDQGAECDTCSPQLLPALLTCPPSVPPAAAAGLSPPRLLQEQLQCPGAPAQGSQQGQPPAQRQLVGRVQGVMRAGLGVPQVWPHLAGSSSALVLCSSELEQAERSILHLPPEPPPGSLPPPFIYGTAISFPRAVASSTKWQKGLNENKVFAQTEEGLGFPLGDVCDTPALPSSPAAAGLSHRHGPGLAPGGSKRPFGGNHLPSTRASASSSSSESQLPITVNFSSQAGPHVAALQPCGSDDGRLLLESEV